MSIPNLETWDARTRCLNVIIETPQGSGNKYNYDHQNGLFRLGGILPAGAVFPFDFGFIPSTLGDDGDPLDVLLVMEESTFAGCLVASRLIGVITAEQVELNQKTDRNDRLIAVPAHSDVHRDVRTLRDLGKPLVDQIEHFFVSYNQIKGKTFTPLGRLGVAQAVRLVKAGQRQFRTQKSQS